MKKIFTFIYDALLFIMITIFSPILIWVVFHRFGNVDILLDYGRLGVFGDVVKVETNTDIILWQGKSHEVPKAIRSMDVYSFRAEDDIVVIKVYRNDKKIAKLKKEIWEDKLK